MGEACNMLMPERKTDEALGQHTTGVQDQHTGL